MFWSLVLDRNSFIASSITLVSVSHPRRRVKAVAKLEISYLIVCIASEKSVKMKHKSLGENVWPGVIYRINALSLMGNQKSILRRRPNFKVTVNRYTWQWIEYKICFLRQIILITVINLLYSLFEKTKQNKNMPCNDETKQNLKYNNA